MMNMKKNITASYKEVEFMDQVQSLLDSKINKLEVGHKIDKNHLRSLYILLKRKIDMVGKEIRAQN